MTPDPYRATATSTGAKNPQNWNRYAYTIGDPINYNDPSGNTVCDPSVSSCSSDTCLVDPFNPVPNPECEPDPVPQPPPFPPPAPDPTCGSLAAPFLFVSKEKTDMLAVELGENSWFRIGQSTLPGTSYPSGPKITEQDVALEDAYMVATMINLANEYHHTIEQDIQSNKYRGYRDGLQKLNTALQSSYNSSDCNDLLTAIGGLIVGQSLNVPFTQWRAAKVGNRIRRMNDGDIRVAGTDFFVR